MTRTVVALTRLTIVISMIIVGAANNCIAIAVVATAWFIGTIERDQKAVTKEAIGKRIDRLRAEHKKYPYKGRLNRSHDWID